jgi:bifunctional DNase/RNase
MFQEARIYSLANVGGQAVLVLEEVNGPRLLPVWIGLYEGGSIGMALAGQKFPRPLTHDLMLEALKRLGAKLEKIVITGLKDSTFYADLYVKKGGPRNRHRCASLGFHCPGCEGKFSDLCGGRGFRRLSRASEAHHGG